MSLHGEPVGAEEVCQVVSMGLSRRKATQVVGREYNDRTVSCWSVGDSRREEIGSSNSGSSDSEDEVRERGFRHGSGGRLQEGDGVLEAMWCISDGGWQPCPRN